MRPNILRFAFVLNPIKYRNRTLQTIFHQIQQTMKIKSFFLIPALIGAIVWHINAQASIKAGVNLASISESADLESYESLKQKSVVGFQAGIAFDLGLSKVFTLQPELLYIQKGGKASYVIDENNKLVNRLYYNYVEVPVLAKLKFYDSEGSGLYIVGGPFIGLALSGKLKSTTTFLGQTTTSEDDFKFENDDPGERQKRTDWGVSFGAGLKMGKAYLDARYNLGINNILDDDTDNQNDNKPYRRTRGLGLTLGFEF